MAVSLPTWGAWIEMGRVRVRVVKNASLPTWGAWIAKHFFCKIAISFIDFMRSVCYYTIETDKTLAGGFYDKTASFFR